MRRLMQILVVLAATLGLVACGGGGGGGDTGGGGGSGNQPPVAPVALVAQGGNQTVTLTWQASAAATSYHVKRAMTSGGPYTELAAPTVTTWNNAGLTNGTTYYYVVTASNAAGESAPSAEVAATPSAELTVLPDNDPTRNHLGMNVWFLNDWDGSFAFVDAIKHARPWRAAANWADPVAVDELGWPLADASTVIYSGAPAQVNGTYKLVFTGQADISILWSGGRGSVSNQQYDAATNTTTADVTFDLAESGSTGLVLSNTRRTAASALNTGFTQMHLYRPGYPTDGSRVFTDEVVNALQKVKVLRLMDWTVTNNNMTVHWSDRMTPQHMSKVVPPYTGPGGQVWATSNAGVALEHQIQLCNEANVDCWINIPVVADDTYVRNMALALRYGTDGINPYSGYTPNPVYPPLKSTLRVYVEYANEIWNSAGGFQNFSAVQDLVAGLPTDHPLFVPATDNNWMNLWRYPAWRLMNVSDIFRSVYGDAQMMTRVRPVLMTQQGNGQLSLEQGLLWLDAYLKRQDVVRPVSYYLYGAGGSGYYNHDIAAADWGNADLFFGLGLPAANIRGMAVDAFWAANFGLKRIAYEGGPSLDFYSTAQANAINLDPRMQDWMVATHDAWSGVGGDLLVYYALRGPGEWEFTPNISSITTPKFAALTTLGSQPRAAVTIGPLLPGTIADAAVKDNRIRTGYDYEATLESHTCIAGNDQGEWIAVPGHSTTAQAATLSVRGSSFDGATIRVWVNGVAQGTITLPVGDGVRQDTSNIVPVTLPKGLVVVRLEAVTGGFALCSVNVQ